MFCPVCRAEYREGFTECNTCRVNLVEDPDNISEKIDGEFLLCRACQHEYHDDEQVFCAECGLKLIRAVSRDDEYVFLEEPVDEYNSSESIVGGMPDFEHLVKIEDEQSAILIESEDLNLLVGVQKLLDAAKIDFELRLPETGENPLGTLLGSGNPLEREFPKILIRTQDEEAAIRIIASNKDLGLAELPPELQGAYDDDEEEAED
jgi:hypothetical protein